MHPTSFAKLASIEQVYLQPLTGQGRRLCVLDVGSKSGDVANTYRPLFDDNRYDYTGLDLEPGGNVDLVPKDPYCWYELADESFDAVISGQTFEHNPYFWITMAEIARVLKPGGLTAVTAPSKGWVHRYPLDCWRFYPDSWIALAAYVGLEVVEYYVESPPYRKAVFGERWGDSLLIARKPALDDPSIRHGYYERLHRIVDTRAELPPVPPGKERRGPAIERYEQELAAPVWRLASFWSTRALKAVYREARARATGRPRVPYS